MQPSRVRKNGVIDLRYLGVILLVAVEAFAAKFVVGMPDISLLHLTLNAAQVGDTIQLCSGDFNFTGNKVVVVNSGVWVIGSIDHSTNFISNNTMRAPLMKICPRDSMPFTIKDINFINRSNLTVQNRGIVVAGVIKDFRITGCTFQDFTVSGIQIYPWSCEDTLCGGLCTERSSSYTSIPAGVIDNCLFTRIGGYAVEVTGIGLNSWSLPINWGTNEFVFIEDCTFHNFAHAVAAQNGARYVFRYNIVSRDTGLGAGTQCIDAHGCACDWECGTRCVEIYGNKIYSPSDDWTAIEIRGGNGVIFNNDLTILNSALQAIRISYEWLKPNVQKNCREKNIPESQVYEQRTTDIYIWNNTFNTKNLIGCDQPYFNSGEIKTAMKQGYSSYAYPHPLRKKFIKGAVLF